MAAATLHPKSADRLAATLGLLGSEHDGERATAAAFADKLLRNCGVTWRELVDGYVRSTTGTGAARPAAASYTAPAAPDDHRTIARWCLARPGLLTAWEARFLADLAAWNGRPTVKQSATLGRIVNKLMGDGVQGRRA